MAKLLPAAERYYTFDEYLALDLPAGYRYELAGGYLVVIPPPSVPHQRFEGDLLEALRAYVREHPVGEALAGVGIRVAADRVRIPDIVVTRGPAGTDLLVSAPPLVAIGILSPGSEGTDRRAKATEYAGLGIDEYWLADPGSRSLELRRLRGRSYRVIQQSQALPGFRFS